MNMARKELTREQLAEVVRKARKGSDSAFEELVDATQSFVRRLAFTVVGAQLLDDVIQECFLTVYLRVDQLKDDMAFLSWLGRIVLHTSYRIKKKHPQATELPETANQPDRTQKVVDSLTLRTALSRLPRNDRDVLVLHELVGLSHAEVGHSLRIPEGTARSRLFTARKRLAEVLGGR
jgi:RNA polymerase sigma-70 factor, ECF subfamily